MIGDGRIQLTESAPGAQTWLAALNANMLQLNNINAWRWNATAGETIAAGELVALDSDGKFYLADSDHATPARRNAFGIALGAAVLDGTFIVQLRGPYTSSSHGLTLGALLYVSETAGDITTTPPTTPRIIGMALDANTLWLDCPSSWAAS